MSKNNNKKFITITNNIHNLIIALDQTPNNSIISLITIKINIFLIRNQTAKTALLTSTKPKKITKTIINLMMLRISLINWCLEQSKLLPLFLKLLNKNLKRTILKLVLEIILLLKQEQKRATIQLVSAKRMCSNNLLQRKIVYKNRFFIWEVSLVMISITNQIPISLI